MKNLLRNLFYSCGIVAAVSATVHQSATPAHGSTPGIAPGIAFVDFSESGVGVLRNDGRVFVCSNSTLRHWTEYPQLAPPIPISEIADWGPTSFLDTSGNGWVNTGGVGWTNAGFPGASGGQSAVPGEFRRQSWSEIKGQYSPKTGGGR